MIKSEWVLFEVGLTASLIIEIERKPNHEDFLGVSEEVKTWSGRRRFST